MNLDQDSHVPKSAGFWSRQREKWSRPRAQLAEGTASSWLGRLVRSNWSGKWQNLTGVLTALFAALFAVHRFAASLFYERLGASPEEVGVGFTQSLESAVVFVLLLIFANVIILIPSIMSLFSAWAHFSSYVGTLWTAGKEQPWGTLAYVLHRLGVLAVFVASGVYAFKLREEVNWWVAIIVLAVAIALLYNFSYFINTPTFEQTSAFNRIVCRTINTSMIIAGALTLIFAGAWVVHAWRDSNSARKGFEVSGFPSVAWRTQHVTISSLQQAPPSVVADIQGSCMMYLGQANGVTVLFDANRQQILRVPTSSIALRTESSRCPKAQ